MNWRNTLIMLVVAVAAGVFVWKVGPNLTSSEERKEMEGRVFKGFKDDRPKIDRVEVVRPGDTIELVKKSEEHWELSKPISYRADHWTAGDLVGKFEFMDSETVLTDSPEKPLKLEEWGLGEGSDAVVVRLYAGEKKLYEARMGELTPDEEHVYLSREGSKDVYLIKKHVRDDFTKKVDEYRSKKITFFPVPEVNKLVLANEKGARVDLEKAGGIWEMKSPVADRASYDTVKECLEALEGLSAAEFLEKNPKDLGEKGLDPAKLTVSVFTGIDFDEQTVLLGSEAKEGERYCMRRGSPFLLKVKTADAEKIVADADVYRSRDLARVKVDTVRQLVVSRGEEKLVLKKKGLDWAIVEPAEYEADSDAALDALQAVKDAEIKEFLGPEAGFEAAVKVRIEYAEAEHAEEFELAKPAKDDELVLARRKGSESVYKVAASLYEDMTRPVLDFRSRSIMDFKREEAMRIERAGPGEEKIAVLRGSKDEPWAIEGDLEKKPDTSAIDDILWAMYNLSADKLVGEVKAAKLAEYGLAEPMLVVTIGTKGAGEDAGKSRVLKVGRPEGADSYYGIVGDGLMVAKLSGGLIDTLKRPLVKTEDKTPEKPEEPAEPGGPAEPEGPAAEDVGAGEPGPGDDQKKRDEGGEAGEKEDEPGI